MEITEGLITDWVNQFVDLYNHQRYEEICGLFSDRAQFINGDIAARGREEILEILEEEYHSRITNCHVHTTFYSVDGTQAMATVEYTVAKTLDAECQFFHSLNNLFFELNTGDLYAVSAINLTRPL
jgi:hypothetical protein